MRGDSTTLSGQGETASGFNPRPSHEGRHNGVSAGLNNVQFQSTPLA